jgi:hypothetical protein
MFRFPFTSYRVRKGIEQEVCQRFFRQPDTASSPVSQERERRWSFSEDDLLEVLFREIGSRLSAPRRGPEHDEVRDAVLVEWSGFGLEAEGRRSPGGVPSRECGSASRRTAGFGLLHRLGFAGALAEVALPTAEIPLESCRPMADRTFVALRADSRR